MSQEKSASLFKKVSTDDGDVPFLNDIWGFFGNKGIKTQFYTINPDQTFKVDIEVCECLGCPIKILTDKDHVVQKWETIRNIVKARKISEEDKDKVWAQGLEKKWILPKNIVVKQTAFNWNTLREEVSATTENRVDLLKIESRNDEEQIVLYSLLNSGYRPGMILVRYTEDPDSSVPSMLVAGHLQMSGYKLCEISGNWFLYLYTDLCLYDSCSWRNTKDNNPIVRYVAEMFQAKATSNASESEVTESK